MVRFRARGTHVGLIGSGWCRLPLVAVVGVLASLGGLCAAAAASADTLTITVQTATPEQDVPVGLEFTGSAGQIDSQGDGPYLYALVRPSGGVPCQRSFGEDQAANDSSTVLSLSPEEVGPGQFDAQTSFDPPDNPTTYLVCAWLEDTTDTADDSAADVTAPQSETFTTRGPQVSELSVALGSAARPGSAYQINYTTQTDQQLNLYSAVKPGGGLPCSSSFELEQQQSETENVIFGEGFFGVADQTVQGGPTTTTATDTEQSAGPYLICAWIEGPNNGEVDAATSTAIYLGTPSSKPVCRVPGFRVGASLSSVEHRIVSDHCAVGGVLYAYSTVKRGGVLRLSPKSGTTAASGAHINVVVSAGREPKRNKPKKKHHR